MTLLWFPVDLPKREGRQCIVSVDLDAIKKAVTKQTVAVMIVHPFGMITTTKADMKSLRSLANEHNLHLLEDCAECFTGLGSDCYDGSEYTDASFFSFGTIKTATALGGGIAVLRHNVLRDEADKMNRMHHSLYTQQTAAEYLCKVLWCFAVRILADCPLLFGMLCAFMSCMGLDFDATVSLSTRSFALRNQDILSDVESRIKYMKQLRKTAVDTIAISPCATSSTVEKDCPFGAITCGAKSIHGSDARESSSMYKGARCDF